MTIRIATITLTNPDPTAWDTPRTWLCHHCGATGSDPQGTDRGIVVLADGVTYLRPHCPTCLPSFTGKQQIGRERTPEYRAYCDQEDAQRRALWEAVRTGLLEARDTDLYRCSVGAAGGGAPTCSGSLHIGRTVVLPFGALYDRGTDLYEHPCSACWGALTPEELKAAHAKRVTQLR